MERNFRRKVCMCATHQAWTKICFALSDALVVVAARTFAASFSSAWSLLTACAAMDIRPMALVVCISCDWPRCMWGPVAYMGW